MEIPFVFPRRWGVGWAAVSVLRPWTAWNGTCARRRCWTRFIRFSAIQANAFPTWFHLLTEEGGLHISQRNVTVSTCGLVPKIRELADQGLTITLALSLHAPNDEVRKSLMPIARTYALKDVLAACHYYFEKTGRRMTFEYSLVQGVNDNLDEARELAALIQDQHGHVNLIPVNPIKERSYVQSGRKAIEAFKGCLESKGINVTIRREMGRDIDGACGQLRKSYMDKEQEKEGAAVK